LKTQTGSLESYIARDIIFHTIRQCFSTFLLPRNPEQAWRSLTEPHALIRASSDVREVEAIGCLYGLISLAEQSPCEDDKASKDDQY